MFQLPFFRFSDLRARTRNCRSGGLFPFYFLLALPFFFSAWLKEEPPFLFFCSQLLAGSVSGSCCSRQWSHGRRAVLAIPPLVRWEVLQSDQLGALGLVYEVRFGASN